ncbi:MAG: alpha/beta fold hydrolase [Ilumatobacteraceae bacterium]
MTEPARPVVVLHHALGLTDGVLAFADDLRGRGLDVHAPDLFDGVTFTSVEDGVAHAAELGFDEVIRRGMASLDGLDTPVVVVGLSLGALPAQCAAQTSDQVSAAVLAGACIPLGEFADEWPASVGFEVHAAAADPVFDGDGDADAATEISSLTPGSHVVRRATGGHLFFEAGHADHDPVATQALVDAVVRFAAPVPTTGSDEPVYRGLDVDAVLDEYQPSRRIASLQAVTDDWATRSAAAHERVPLRHHRFGDHPDEWFWYVPATDPAAPLFAFVHGGYWRRLSADDGLILAEAAHRHGFAFASVNYTLCPHGSLATLIDQTRRAVRHLVDGADDLGHDAARVHLVGHSAGAHLAAWTAITEPRLAGLVLVSGVYDITPLVHVPINDDVRMTPEQAAEWSPAGRAPSAPTTPCIVTHGSLESSEFARQSAEWAAEWSAVPGNGPATTVVADGRNHFDVLDDLLDPSRPLGTAVLQSMRSM